MKRREFLRNLALLSSLALIDPAKAISHFSDAFEGIRVNKLSTLPKVIHIYLYGGASELVGNTSNVGELRDYINFPDITTTENDFWLEAGGDILEELLVSNDMSIVRTINRQIHKTKTHRICINENLSGRNDEFGPGLVDMINLSLIRQGIDTRSLKFPYVSFEGNSKVFSKVDIRPLALAQNLRNIYKFQKRAVVKNIDYYTTIEDLSKTMNRKDMEYSFISDTIRQQKYASKFLEDFTSSKKLPSGVSYPDTTSGKLLQAAVSLLDYNEDTVFVSLGSCGTGNWDDHSGFFSNYPKRMKQLLEAIKSAIDHINALGRDDIIISVYGDFGRNLYVNTANGLDHGDNQNWYTFGGRRFRELGNIIGETKLTVQKDKRRIYTTNKDNSVRYEPYSIASTIWSYYGLQNPETINQSKIITL